MKAIRGVLLDIDGTLVDSNDAHAYAWVKALAECDHPISFETIRPLIGMGGDKLLPKIIGIEAESEEGKAISKERASIFQKDYLPYLRPTQGAEDLLRQLKERGFKLAVASSSKRDELKPLLRICKADEVIEDATSADDEENSKPDPDILHAAMGQLDLPAAEVALIGDTTYDVEAARKAGIRIIGLCCGGSKPSELLADEVYADPAELCSKLDSSMLAKADE